MATNADNNVEAPLLPTATLDKYKAAGQVVANALAALVPKCVEGAVILDLAKEGDKLVEQGTASLYNKVKGMPKGVAFPTSLSINNVIQNHTPLPSDSNADAKLQQNDVVKIQLGAHFDGYAVISAETVVVTKDSSVSEQRAALLAAVHNATEVALRLVKPGGKNWEVTEGVKKVLAEYSSAGVKGVETILSHQFEQNNIEAKKGIVAFPNEQQRRDGDNAFLFEEGEVYGLNIVVTTGEKTPKTNITSHPTTIYQKTDTTYLLKMKTSRATFSEISKKAGSFPFSLRVLDEEAKARMGVRECVQHNLLKAFEVVLADKPTDLTAQSFVTFAVSKTGATRLSLAPTFYSADKVKSPVEIQNDEVKAILARPLKPKPAKKAKKDATNGAPAS